MNILGNPFEQWVTDQINSRQTALGKYTNIDSNTLKFYSAKTPFLRLASSVDLTNEAPNDGTYPITAGDQKISSVLQKLTLPENLIKGSALAKNFILHGGAVSDNPQFSGLAYGVNTSNNLFQGAYGWGGINNRGYVPMPGITKASVQYYNNGALSKTIIDIKCFSKEQFQLIDVLYLRPGYTLLLEFGWTLYLDNQGNLQSFKTFDTEPLRNLLNPSNINQYQMWDLIKEERKTHNGNYEAIFGKISNFTWKFNSDGTYDIQIQLTSVGDVIESLKMNIASTSPTTNNDSSKSDIPLVANKDKTILHNELYLIYWSKVSQSQPLKVSAQNPDAGKVLAYNIAASQNATSDYIMSDFSLYNPNDGTFSSTTLTISNGILKVPVKTSSKDKNQRSPQVYITFGTLLAIIENKLLLYNITNNVATPHFRFDMDFNGLDNDQNYIFKVPGQFSSDPTVCLIPWDYGIDGELKYDSINDNPLKTVLDNGAAWKHDDYLGRLANIYVNIEHIEYVLSKAPIDKETNSIPLLGFLKELISDISEALGGINKIRIHVDNGLIKFTEDIPQNFTSNSSSAPTGSYARFNIYGVKPGVEGSFIHTVDLTTTLSNDFASMISIGAQVNGNQLSENATAFSTYNAGLVDRIIPKKVNKTSTTAADTSKRDELVNEFNKNINPDTNGVFQKIYGNGTTGKAGNLPDFSKENISYLKSHNNQYLNLVAGELSKDFISKNLKGPFFLPFNLSLSMDGLSGMVLYQKFLITDDILPPSYTQDGVDLIIRGINHEITPKEWTTKLDTLSVPAFKTDKVKRPEQKHSTVTGTRVASSPTVSGATSNALDKTTTDTFYKQLLNKLGAPQTDGNLLFLKAWRQAEGGMAKYNPFNTTLRLSGSTTYNTVGVQNYSDINQGVQATADTLTKSGGYYNGIVSALVQGISSQKEAQSLATSLQQKGKSLYIWQKGPNATDPFLQGYVAAVLQYTVSDVPIYG